VSGSSSGGSSPSPLREGPARVEMCEQPLQLCGLRLQARIPGFRLLPDALQPALDVVAVGDEELELQRLEVVGRDAGAGEPVEDD
jgi:hypothetical protein